MNTVTPIKHGVKNGWQEEFDTGFKEGREQGILIGQILYAQRYLAFTGEELQKKSLNPRQSRTVKIVKK